MSSDLQESRVEDLRVLYDFEYQTKDDRTITISQGEKLFLIAKTNADWWQVIRSSRERPFFVPAQYVEAADDGQRILSDRRKSWAVEELLLELTRRRPQPEPAPDYDVDTDNKTGIRVLSRDKTKGAAVSSDDETRTSHDSVEKREAKPRYNRVSVHLPCVNDVNGNVDDSDREAAEFPPANANVDDAKPDGNVRVVEVNNRNRGGGDDVNRNLSSVKATARVEPGVPSVPSVPSESAAVKSPRSRVSVHLERIGGGDSALAEFRAKRDSADSDQSEVRARDGSQSAAADFAAAAPPGQSHARTESAKTPEVLGEENPFRFQREREDLRKAPEIIAKAPEIIAKAPEIIAKATEIVSLHSESRRKDGRARSENSETAFKQTPDAPLKSRSAEFLSSQSSDPFKAPGQSARSESKPSYARVSVSPEVPRPSRRGPKVTRLSESLERLAQQIQFSPPAATEPRNDPGVPDFGLRTPESGMFPDATQRLTHSRSFKCGRELARMQPPVAAPRSALAFRNPAFHRSADDLLSLPSATGSSLPSATGSSLPSATGSSLPSATGSSLPSATGSLLPSATGSSWPSATGSSWPSATGSLLPSATGSSLPSATGKPSSRWDVVRDKTIGDGKTPSFRQMRDSFAAESRGRNDRQTAASFAGPSDVAQDANKDAKDAKSAAKGPKVRAPLPPGKDAAASETAGRKDSAPEARKDSAPEARKDSAPEARKDSAPEARKDSAPEARKDEVPAPSIARLSSGSRSSLDELVSAFEARSRSGSNTSDDAVLERSKPRGKSSLSRANRVQVSYKNVTEGSEPSDVDDSEAAECVPVPPGWTRSLDSESGLPCFLHPSTGDKWFSSSDSQGRVYFFEENSPSSTWTLPTLTPPSPPAKPHRNIPRNDSDSLGTGGPRDLDHGSSNDRKGSFRDVTVTGSNGRKDSFRDVTETSSKERLDSFRDISKDSSKERKGSYREINKDSSKERKGSYREINKDSFNERRDSYKEVTKDVDSAKESRERKDSVKEGKKEKEGKKTKDRDQSKDNAKDNGRKDSVKDSKTVIGAKPSMASIASLLLAERRAGGGVSNRAAKTMSMILPSTSFPEEKPTQAGHPIWPQLFENNTMRVVREGLLHRARVLDQGRKVRKAWGSSYVVLTELFLLFFADQKQAQALLCGPVSASTPPELCVPLSGATVSRCDRAASSRKHALSVSAANEACDVLLQCETQHAAECWEHDLRTVVQLLPRSEPVPVPAQSPSAGKKSSAKVQRSKSMKLKGGAGLRAMGSLEDLTAPGASAADSEDRHRIRARLRKFFVRRPTREALVKKGIYKDEPMFGRLLSDVMLPGQPAPAFVIRCVERIESRRENVEADGLYRVSGNLSQVQRIRLAADQNNLGPLDAEEDVHVITGALKLFFRELKQPLIPCHLYVQSLKACSEPSRAERVRQFGAMVKALPGANRSTLRYLLQHLLRVSAEASSNRMHVANVAIVFGPTLMWSTDAASTHMATELMQQNLVVEHLLLNFGTLF